MLNFPEKCDTNLSNNSKNNFELLYNTRARESGIMTAAMSWCSVAGVMCCVPDLITRDSSYQSLGGRG